MYYLAAINVQPYVIMPDNIPLLLCVKSTEDTTPIYSNRWQTQGLIPMGFIDARTADQYGMDLMNKAKEEGADFIPILMRVRVTDNNMRKMESAIMRHIREDKCLITELYKAYQSGIGDYPNCIFKLEQDEKAQIPETV